MEPKIIFFIAMGLLGGSCLFLIVGTATTYWMSYGYSHAGLFKYCSGSCGDIQNAKGGMYAARFFEVTAILLAVATIVCCIVYFLKQVSKLSLVANILAYVTATFAFLGVIAFSATYNTPKSWSMHLAWFGGLLSLVAGVALNIYRKKVVTEVSASG